MYFVIQYEEEIATYTNKKDLITGLTQMLNDSVEDEEDLTVIKGEKVKFTVDRNVRVTLD